jgi:hypothetical protein
VAKIILPEVNLASIWVFKRGQLVILHFLDFASVNPLRLQVFNGLIDVVYFEANSILSYHFSVKSQTIGFG